MSKYLFLLDELPPTQSANGICAEKVMSCLRQSGDVFCVSWDDLEKVKEKPFHCTTIPKKPWTRLVLSMKGKQGSYHRWVFLAARVIYWMKRMLLLPVWPVDSVSCAFRFFSAARKLIKENDITHVIAVSYPGETLLAMCMLKRQFGSRIKTIMYPLDVSLEGVNHGSAVEKKLSCVLGRRFMRFCVRRADQLLVLENAMYLYNKVFPESERKNFSCCGIPLLENIDWTQYASDASSKENEIHFVFGGNLLYSMRNPTALLDLIEAAPWPEEKQIYFDLYGKADAQIQELWKGRYQRLRIIEHGWVDEAVLNGALLSADVLVSVGNHDRHLIPSKLFKYMTTGKKIVHLSFSQHDPCIPYLQKYENYFLLDAAHMDEERLVHFSTAAEYRINSAATLFPTCIPQYTAELIQQ
jgi:hypothetical protein